MRAGGVLLLAWRKGSLDRYALALKSSVAGVLAWLLCAGLHQQPYPAAVAALLSVQPTIFGSLKAALRYAGGCALGALIALPVMLVLGPSWLGLGIVLVLSSLAAGNQRFGHHGVHVPLTALFVSAFGRLHIGEKMGVHLLEIGVGVAIGAAFNVALPPLRLRPAEMALDGLRSELYRVLRGLGLAVDQGRPPEETLGRRWQESLTTAVTQARGTLAEAHESRRWNPRARARRTAWHLDDHVLTTLERLAHDTDEITRALVRTPRRAEFRTRYARLLHGTALCVRGCQGGRPHPVLPATRRGWEQLADATRRCRGGLGAQTTEGRLLMILDRSLSDLGAADTVRQADLDEGHPDEGHPQERHHAHTARTHRDPAAGDPRAGYGT